MPSTLHKLHASSCNGSLRNALWSLDCLSTSWYHWSLSHSDYWSFVANEWNIVELVSVDAYAIGCTLSYHQNFTLVVVGTWEPMLSTLVEHIIVALALQLVFRVGHLVNMTLMSSTLLVRVINLALMFSISPSLISPPLVGGAMQTDSYTLKCKRSISNTREST